MTVCVIDVDEQEEARLNVLLNNPSMQGDWDLDKLAMMTDEFDLDLQNDMGFTESDIDMLFDGDDRFSNLFETKESEEIRHDMQELKDAHHRINDENKSKNSIDWLEIIVFPNEESRKAFLKRISVPASEKYITEEQVNRLSSAKDQ